MNDRELKNLETYVARAESTLASVIYQSRFLALTEKEARVRNEAVKILSKKLKTLRKAETVSDVKKVLKVKRIIKANGARA